MLRLLAERMSALLRPEDTAARLGGDEFAILCVNADPRHAEAIAERLRAAVAEPLTVDGQQLVLSATVGVSSSGVADDPPPADPADLLRRADLEMYRAEAPAGVLALTRGQPVLRSPAAMPFTVSSSARCRSASGSSVRRRWLSSSTCRWCSGSR